MTWTWNQTDSKGQQVGPGLYIARLTTSEGDSVVQFNVSGLRCQEANAKGEPPMPPVRPFKDVTGEVSWGDPHILRLYEKGIVNGMGDGRFAPQETLTRAQFLAMLLRALGVEPSEGEYEAETLPFPDVPPNHWAFRYVVRARELGIITDDEYAGSFGPDQPISRLEICIMAVRALGLDHEAVHQMGEALPFQDSDEVPLNYRGYVRVASGWDVVRGFDDNTVRPFRYATRREACVMVYRILAEE